MNIALDVDGCEANFIKSFILTAQGRGISNLPRHWTDWRGWDGGISQNDFRDVFAEIADKPAWWLSIDPMDDAYVNFQPAAYITDRPIASKYTHSWLTSNGFPDAPVITTGQVGQSKSEIMKTHGIDLIVEDRIANFKAINKTKGVCAVLLRRPWNHSISGKIQLNPHYYAPVHMCIKWMADLPLFIENNPNTIQQLIDSGS